MKQQNSVECDKVQNVVEHKMFESDDDRLTKHYLYLNTKTKK